MADNEKSIILKNNNIDLYLLKKNIVYTMAEERCLTHILAHIPKVVEQSSHYFFQYGLYNDCIASPSMNYNVLTLGVDQQSLGLFFALCLPEECSSNFIKNSFNAAFERSHLPLTVLTVDSDIKNYQFTFTPLFYITVAILAILVVLVLLSTLAYKSKQQHLKSFALQETAKFFNNREGSDLNIFNGVRAFAMMWVVFGHLYLNSLAGNVNTLEIADVFKEPFTLLVQAGLLSVDVFFFLGGFFLAFVFFKQKSKSYLKYPLAILQRVLRIWPCYIATMLIYYTIFMHLGSGPRWSSNQPIVLICKDMWRSMLFVDNLVGNGEEQCLAWGWYLQVDFQIFLVCMLILLIYSHKRKVALVVSSVLILGSWAFNIIFTQREEVKLFTSLEALMNFQKYFLDIYIKPYARWSPYILGLLFGLLYSEYSLSVKEGNRERNFVIGKCHRLKQFFQRTRSMRIVVEWSGIGLMAFLAFIPRTLQAGYEWPQILHSLYLCFSRVLFNLGIVLTLGPSLLGIKSSFFRTVLDTSLFNIIAKLSFCGYLVHYMIISQFLAAVTYDTYYQITDRFVIDLGLLVLTFVFAALMVIIIEVPFATLQKELMNKLKDSSKKSKEAPRIAESLIQSQKLEATRTSIQ